MIIITLQGHEGEVCETNENELFVESDDSDTKCSEVETSAVAQTSSSIGLKRLLCFICIFIISWQALFNNMLIAKSGIFKFLKLMLCKL